jgi:segregation and condensation protein A
MPENAEQIPNGQKPLPDLVDLIDQPAWKSILLELVKTEQMDPWDIDLCALADKFLEKVSQREHANLKIPANAILASAILLKMKARTLKLHGIDDEEAAEELSQDDIQMLEDSIPELKGVRRFRQGKVSLDELVEGIADVLNKTKHKQNSILRSKELPEFNVLVSEGSIEEKVLDIEERISKRADSQGLVTFSQLLNEKTPVEMVHVFVPLLFLMNKGKINAWQEEWFGEIMVALLDGDEAKKPKD